jgi:hypothetical protein
MPLLLHSRCPKPVQISGLGTGTRLFYAQTSLTTDLKMNIQSGLLLQSWNKWKHIEMPYYFSWFMARLFTDQSVYFYISNCSWNYKPSGVCQRGFSLSVWVMGKSWPHSATSNYLYLFVWANLCILFILFFKLSFWNSAETELKCNTGFRENIPLAFYHIQTVGA